MRKWSKTEAVTLCSKINMEKMMIREKYIGYQFLCDKLWSNLAAKSNKYLLSHWFYGSDIWTWLSEVPNPQGLSQDLDQCVCQGCSLIWRPDWRGCTCKLTHVIVSRIQLFLTGTTLWTESLSASLTTDWRPSSVPCHMGLSIGHLKTWPFALTNQAREPT